MAQDLDLIRRMAKALSLAQQALVLANLKTPVGSQPIGQPHPDLLPMAILAAALFNHIEAEPRPSAPEATSS